MGKDPINYLLAIDASLPTPFLLLCKDKEILEFCLLSSRSSEEIAPAVQGMLQTHGLSPCDLTSLSAGVGPGSYTGIRAALSFISALGKGLDLPVHGFCALLALAPKEPGTFAVAIDARSAGIWGAIANPCHNFLSSPQKIPPEAIADFARPYGAIWSLSPEKIAAKLEIKSIQTPLSILNPHLIRDICDSSALPLTPNYLGKGVASCQPVQAVVK